MSDDTEDTEKSECGTAPVPLFGADDAKIGRLKGLLFFSKVHDMVIGGWPPKEVAIFIRTKKKELLDLSEEQVQRLVVAYRNSLPSFDRVVKVYPDSARKALETIEEGLDELQELEHLYRLQMSRLKIDYETEKEIGKLLPTTGGEVRIARDLLMSRAQLKMDLGLDSGAREKLATATGNADDALRGKPQHSLLTSVLSNSESRQKFLNAFNKLSKINSVKETRPVIDAESEVSSKQS